MSEAVTIDTIKNILTKNVNKEYSLSREEAIAIMNLPEDDMPLLMEMAGSLRKKYKGNHVSIHLLTNARSGNCSQNCAYCAQSCRSKAEIEKYKKELWHHEPLSDFWQIGKGIERRLNKMGIFDMYDIAHTTQKRLYKEFGVNAEYLIDHSWGKESCTIADIKAYKPKTNSITNSQVLFEDYSFIKARLVLKEMVELGSLRLIESNLVTDTVGLYIGYSKNTIKATGGTRKLTNYTNIYSELLKAFLEIYDKTTDTDIPIRRIGVNFANVIETESVQLSLFIDQERMDEERKLELAMCSIKNKMGKNAIIRGMDLEDGATTIMRNKLIGGHNSGE